MLAYHGVFKYNLVLYKFADIFKGVYIKLYFTIDTTIQI